MCAIEQFKSYFLLLILILEVPGGVNSQWINLPTGTAYSLNSVSAIDDNNVWVSGGALYRTTNGGSNWIACSTSGFESNFISYNIFGIDQLDAIISGYKVGSPDVGQSYKTTNSGVSWYKVFSQNNGFINAVWMRNAAEGILVGDPVGGFWTIFKTTNAGNNWFQSGVVAAGIGETGVVNSLYVIGDNIWFGANTNGWLYFSSNFGLNWIKQYLTSAYGPYAIYFINPSTGMCGGPSHVHYTTNSGANWISLPNPGTGAAVGIAGNGSFWLVGKFGRSVYSTSNSGMNWSLEYQTPDNSIRNHMSKSRTGNRVWEVRNNGVVGRRGGPLGISLLNSEVPLEDQLEQNYPNPFNPHTNIVFKLSRSSGVKIILYDAAGRVISYLLNDFLRAGNYSILFNSSGLSSGVYYYSMIATNFNKTKKMVVIK